MLFGPSVGRLDHNFDHYIFINRLHKLVERTGNALSILSVCKFEYETQGKYDLSLPIYNTQYRLVGTVRL